MNQRLSVAAVEPPSPHRSLFRRSRTAAVALTVACAMGITAIGAAPAMAATVDSTIAAVQGAGAASPFAGDGNSYTVQGVVTADQRTGGFDGVYIQAQGSGGETDATPGVSDGLFVYLGTGAKPELAIGDLVQVTGPVSEYFGLTQITPSAAGAFTVLEAGVGVPAATALPDTLLGGDREALEGMLVAPAGSYTLASSHQLFNFGTLWLSAGAGLPVQPTVTEQPGPAAQAIAAATKAKRILLDDGYNAQVSSSAHVGEQPYFSKDVVVRNGDTVAFGAQPLVLSFGRDDWRLHPTVPITNTSDAAYKGTFTTVNPRPTAAPEVGGDVQLAAFNVFNYFTTLTTQNSNARGARTPEAFAIQESKIVAAINGLGADVVALQEIENSVKLGEAKDEALAHLVGSLNAAGGDWSYVPTPDALANAATTDFITTAIIYRAAAVTPVGPSKTVPTDETVWGNAREPIAQTFTFQGKTITVVTNHMKSKTPPSGSTGEPADGQGWFNEDRTKQAQATLAFTDQLRAEAGSDDVFLIGDFNAYAEEDPIDVFTDAGWTDLSAGDHHTYTFNGAVGSLDHVIASPSVAATVTGVGVWGINSPEWGDRGFAFGATEAGTPFRSSDHDPTIVGVSKVVTPVDIDLVTVNDFHGRIANEGTGSATAGAAALSTAVKGIRAANPNTVFAAAGDLIGASTFTSFIQQDQPTIDALNAAGLDVSSVGNHEFDRGFADLRDRVMPAALWKYLGANVFLKTGERALPAYTTKTFQGVTVGFIGAVTNELPSLVSPAGIAELDVRDVTTSVNQVADELRDGDPANGEADVVVLLVHEGAATTNIASATDPASAFGKIVNGVDSDVDAIVSGHTHLAYNHVINGRPVISSGQYGERFSDMKIQVNPQTNEILSMVNQTIDMKTRVVSGGTTTFTPNFTDDPAVAPIVAAAVEKARELGAVKVGDITADFRRATQTVPTAENRGGESTLGNFVADVQLWSAQRDAADIQVALMNPGGLRANLLYASTGPADPDGNLTFKEAADVQPFANTLVTMTLTGAQLKEVLEQQWQPAAASRPFLKLGVSKSLSYTSDATAAAGSRITNMYLNGAPIAAGDSVRVVVNSFLASGGDNFTTLAQGTSRADSGKVDLQSMVDYFAVNLTASPDTAQRAVGVKLSAPANGTSYLRGEQVTAALSSLVFTGAPAGQTVELSLGGAVVGSATIDPAIVDTTDEMGRASVTFTIPVELSGAQQLTIVVPATGTSIAVPIVLEDPVPLVASRTLGVANTLFGNHNRALKYTVIVRAEDGSAVTGEVNIYDGSTLLTTVTLAEGDNGRLRVTLPKLSRGLHLLKAEYAGSATVEGSTSPSFPVFLW